MSNRTKLSQISKVFSRCGRNGAHIGMDVHKKNIHVAIWIRDRVVRSWVMPADYSKAAETFAPHRDRIAKAVYEAGPTGYGLARTLKHAGIKTDVIAPGRTPRPASRENKSDRVDAKKLAEYSAKGLLCQVAIPTETQEADRQVIRLRDQLMSKRKRVKNQIKGFLLQHGIAEPEGLKGWTIASVAALRNLRLRPQLRFCLDALLDELEHFNMQVKRATREISRLAGGKRYSAGVELLRSHPAVGELTAMVFLTEVYRAGRFRNSRQLSSFLGLAPMVRESGETRREGNILKTGRGPVRGLLVEAAWRWIGKNVKDTRAKEVYRRLVSNTGNAKKAIVGIARRLAVVLWTMLSTGELYREVS